VLFALEGVAYEYEQEQIKL